MSEAYEVLKAEIVDSWTSGPYAFIPIKSKFLSVGVQDGKIVAWFLSPLVEGRKHTLEKRSLLIVGTGWADQPIFEDCRFLGTVQMPSGLVFHVFDPDRYQVD